LMMMLMTMTMVIGVLSLPDFGLEKKSSPSVPYNSSCVETDFCLKSGAKCDNSSKVIANCITNSSASANCCPSGEFCSRNGTCAKNNYGAACSNVLECRPDIFGTLAVSCTSGHCYPLYGAGDNCNTDADCMSPLKCGTGSNKTCTGLPVGSTGCTAGFRGQLCAIGLVCLSNVCQKTVASTASCDNIANICPANYYCVGGKCLKLGSVANNAACGGNPFVCTSGSTCNLAGNCVAGAPLPSVTCTNTSQCSSVGNSSTCECTDSGKGMCTPSLNDLLLNNLGYNDIVSLANCLATKGCAYDYTGSDPTSYANSDSMSCTVVNCNSYYKKVMAAGCGFQKFAGTCSYNPWCAGFPVWAIIVIVVVAVLLVLAVVFVIFLVLRKRRDYSSI